MNKLLSIILCLMLFSECKHSQHNDSGLTTINIIDGIRRSIKMPVSVISDNISFIPLETFDENIIAKITKILLYDNHIIVIDDLPQILLFDKTGKFVRKIGNTEEGKSEFLSIYSSVVVNNELFVWDVHSNTTFCYNLQTGKCVRTLLHKFIPFSIEYFNDSLLIYYCSMPQYPGVPFSHLHFISPDFEKSDSMWYDTEYYSLINREFFDEGRVNSYMRNGNMYIWDSNLDCFLFE
jgi:hypothetical protein